MTHRIVMKKEMTTPPSDRKRRRIRTVLIIIGVLVLIRLILPYLLLRVANNRLAKIPGYYGHIQDLDLALLRGAYRVQQFEMLKVDSVSQKRTPFLAAEDIDLSVEWKALFHGSIVGELVITKPEVRFTNGAAEPGQVVEDTTSFRELLDDMMPLRINRIEAHHGSVRYVDPASRPKVDVELNELDVLALNLSNSYDSVQLLPSSIVATALVYGGTLNFNMKLDPLAKDPTLDMNAELKSMQLTRVNEVLQAYANVDVNKGTFGLYTEVATRNREFEGYVKPVIKGLDVLGKEDRKDNVFQKLWEGMVGTVGDALTNPKKDQVATKVVIKGKLDGPRANIFYAVVDLLRNAFIQALKPALDQEVSIATVGAAESEHKGFFKKLFGGGGNENDKEQGTEEKK